jgi:hypothetical protein
MQICKARYDLSQGIDVWGSGNKPYRVIAFRKGEFPFCSCPSYVYKRAKAAREEGVDQRTMSWSCKHLDQILPNACAWQQERPEDYRYNDICPACGGPLVDVGDGTGDDQPADPQDLKRLLEELS